MTFDQETSLRLVGEMLGMLDRFGEVEQINVRNVKIIDQSLSVQILAGSDDPIRLRGQAASVMGGLSGLDLPNLFPALHFTSFAVRLCDQRGDDVFWVVSSPEDARFATYGAVRWLANSIVQDNTSTYRRSQADRLIAQVETGLGDLLHLHWHAAHGDGYSPSVLTVTLLNDLRKMARREGEDDRDDRTLLDFTMLPQLANSACNEPLLVAHGCVTDPQHLQEDLAKLKKIRNKVAHHRNVTRPDLEIARAVSASILRPVGEHHPSLITDFLADRWDDAVAAIMKDISVGMRTEDPPKAGTMSETERQRIAAEMFAQQLDAAKEGLASLRTLVVPPIRQSIHERAEQALGLLVGALDDMTEVARLDSLTLADARAAVDRHARAMEDIQKLGEQVAAIRVMEHAVE